MRFLPDASAFATAFSTAFFNDSSIAVRFSSSFTCTASDVFSALPAAGFLPRFFGSSIFSEHIFVALSKSTSPASSISEKFEPNLPLISGISAFSSGYFAVYSFTASSKSSFHLYGFFSSNARRISFCRFAFVARVTGLAVSAPLPLFSAAGSVSFIVNCCSIEKYVL